MIKELLGKIHAPKPSDRPIIAGKIIGNLINFFLHDRKRQFAEAEQYRDELERMSSNPYIEKEDMLKRVNFIVDHIKIEYLLDFYLECRYNFSELVIQRWQDKIIFEAKAVRRKNVFSM